LRDRNGAGTSDHTIAGPLSRNVTCGDSLDIVQTVSTPQSNILNARRACLDAVNQVISVLAELFPVCFAAERWQPHRPLKIGIHQDLIDRGVLLPGECRTVFSQYCSRLMYLRAVASGGLRCDLDGYPAGEVMPDEMKHAHAFVAHLEAKALAKAAAARQEAEKKRIARCASKAEDDLKKANEKHANDVTVAEQRHRDDVADAKVKLDRLPVISADRNVVLAGVAAVLPWIPEAWVNGTVAGLWVALFSLGPCMLLRLGLALLTPTPTTAARDAIDDRAAP
jgi:sRNA-binding protein